MTAAAKRKETPAAARKRRLAANARAFRLQAEVLRRAVQRRERGESALEASDYASWLGVDHAGDAETYSKAEVVEAIGTLIDAGALYRRADGRLMTTGKGRRLAQAVAP